MTNTEQLREQLLNKLKELFQLNQPDLDFGFYRIMHSRAKEVTAFIENELLDTIKSAFDSAKVEGSQNDFDAAKAKVIDNIGEDAFDENGKLKAMYANSKAGKEFLAAQQKLADADSALTGEDSVYYHLYRFFSRYYDNGDFVSMRYHTRETEGMARPYAIPYGGEEVMLHWANADQYYIKTSENFNNFSFDLTKATVFDKMGWEEKILAGIPDTPLMVHFKVVDADEGEHGNIKADPNKKREFFLAAENPVQLDSNGELEIHFEFRQAEDSDKITPEDEALVKEAYSAKNKGDFPLLAITAKIIAACHDLNQKLLNEKSPCSLDYYMAVMQYPCPTDAVKKRILLSKYLYQYTARNTSDYFIHKNLRGFLRREMDFYIKNEIMNLDDIEQSNVSSVENYLILLKVFRKIAGKLIDFLGQLEDFQKKLWLKKKFITQCDYCITLDRVPEEFYPEIWNNEAQLKEWQKLGFISDVSHDYGSWNFSFCNERYHVQNIQRFAIRKEIPTKDLPLLQDTPIFPVMNIKNTFGSFMADTKFFDADFKMRLLAKIPDLDEQCDGVLIHSENFQALNLLQERYKEQVKCIYIDPPYNTEQDREQGKFIYKDNFDNSSWLSFMKDRILLTYQLMRTDSTIFSSIDHNEIHAEKYLYELIFTRDNFEGLISWRRRHNQPNDKTKMLSMVSEYILSYAKDSKAYKSSGVGKLGLTGDFSNPDNDPRGDWASKPWKVGSDQSGSRYTIVSPSGIVFEEEWMGDKNTYEQLLSDGRIYFPKKSKKEDGCPRKKYYRFEREEEGQCATNWWSHEFFGHNQGANDELTALMGEKNTFSNPKPTLLVKNICQVANLNRGLFIDFFAGSGSSGNAVIAFNRENPENHNKYLLIEMGEHFDKVLKPRIEKVVFSEKWKDGKPVPETPIKLKQQIHHNETVERDGDGNELTLSFDVGLDKQTIEKNEKFDVSNPFNGVSHCFKYMRLESYEDTLNNLVMPEEDSYLAKMNGSLKEDYMLHYMLDAEAQASLLNIRDFADPWGYQLKVKQPNSEASVVSPVDLVETFNYLIGLRIQQYYRIQNYSVSFKRSLDPELPNGGEQTRLELETKPELDSDGAWRFQKIEGWIPANPQTPNDGRKKNVLIIWRTLTGNLEQDNLMLDWYMSGTLNLDEKTPEYDIIYVNGSNNLGADRKESDTFQVRLIEEEFLKKMWTAGEC